MTPVGSKLERRVTTAADELLARRHFVAPVEMLQAIGWLPPRRTDAWRRSEIADLVSALQAGPDRLVEALDILQRWASAAGLEPTEIEYVTATRDRRQLRFSATGGPDQERLFRTHWTSPGLSAATRRRITERQSAQPDLLAVVVSPDWCCDECGEGDSHQVKEGDRALCLGCTDMDHLIFLPAGDAAMTRRAKKASTLSAVVVRWQQRRRRYQRLGLLVEPAALDAAEQQCLGDGEARQRRRERDRERRRDQDVALVKRMSIEILRLFPGCPEGRAEAIAAHTALRGSGRVGRSAAGRALSDDALTSAVVASVRHEETDYDELLMAGVPRAEARARIRIAIDRVLVSWRATT